MLGKVTGDIFEESHPRKITSKFGLIWYIGSRELDIVMSICDKRISFSVIKVNLDQLVLGWSSFKIVSIDSQLSKMVPQQIVQRWVSRNFGLTYMYVTKNQT
jgi:hypothetical protein